MRGRCPGFVLALLACGAPSAGAQTAQDTVRATVQEFFRTMTDRDSAGARRVLLDDGVYWRTRESGTEFITSKGTNAEYIERLGTPGEKLLERMWQPTVQVHGRIAMLWTEYDFHVDGKFSHCGVDAFTLLRTDAGWKIASIAWTVELTGCAPSPLGAPRP
jgi:ketosteroid isomerase-like protein